MSICRRSSRSQHGSICSAPRACAAGHASPPRRRPTCPKARRSARHKGCGRLSARLPNGQLQASDRAVRRTVRPDNLPGRELQHAGTYGQAVRRGSGADRRHRARQRGDRQRQDQRAREGQDALAMDVRLRHRRLSYDRADARQVRADGLSRRRAAEGVAVGSPAGAVHTCRGAPVLPRASDP